MAAMTIAVGSANTPTPNTETSPANEPAERRQRHHVAVADGVEGHTAHQKVAGMLLKTSGWRACSIWYSSDAAR